MNDEEPPTLFDLPEEHKNKFEPEPQTQYERAKKQARNTDPNTSHEAAKKALPKMGSEKAVVLNIFDERFPNDLADETLEEIAVERGVWPGNASKRRSDLTRDGFLVWSGNYHVTKANKRSKKFKRNGR